MIGPHANTAFVDGSDHHFEFMPSMFQAFNMMRQHF